jgi:hypothetical protein
MTRNYLRPLTIPAARKRFVDNHFRLDSRVRNSTIAVVRTDPEVSAVQVQAQVPAALQVRTAVRTAGLHTQAAVRNQAAVRTSVDRNQAATQQADTRVADPRTCAVPRGDVARPELPTGTPIREFQEVVAASRRPIPQRPTVRPSHRAPPDSIRFAAPRTAGTPSRGRHQIATGRASPPTT